MKAAIIFKCIIGYLNCRNLAHYLLYGRGIVGVVPEYPKVMVINIAGIAVCYNNIAQNIIVKIGNQRTPAPICRSHAAIETSFAKNRRPIESF